MSCKYAFTNGKNTQTVEIMRSLRDLMWEIDAGVRDLKSGNDAWQNLKVVNKELILLSNELYLHAVTKYITPRIEMIEPAKRPGFIKKYEASYKALIFWFEKLDAAIEARESVDEVSHIVAQIRDFSTRMHYKY